MTNKISKLSNRNETQSIPGRLVQLFLYMYIIAVGLGELFSIENWFKLHVMTNISILFFWLINFYYDGKFLKRYFHFEDIFLTLFLLGIYISGISKPNSKTINYLLAYTYIFGIGYLFLKAIFFRYGNINKILFINFITVFFVSLFVSMEFLLETYLGINIQALLPIERPAKATVSGIYSRSYGFFNEPTILALYLNTLGFTGIYYFLTLYNSNNFIVKSIKPILFFVYIIAWVSTFSTAGFASLILSILFCILFIFLSERKNLIVYSIIFVSMLIIAIFIFQNFTIKPVSSFKRVAKMKINKVLSGQSTPGQKRIKLWKKGIETAQNNPILGRGIGKRSAEGKGSTINFYLFLTIEGGLISSIPFVLFLLSYFLRILNSDSRLKFGFLIPIMAGYIHFLAISTVHHPHLWLLMIIATICLSPSELKSGKK